MKKTLSILIFSLIFLSSCVNEGVVEKKYYKTYTVWEWYISSKDFTLSTVVWMNISDLSFKNSWRIKEIFVKKWDVVKEWQILATLTNEEANINYLGSMNILSEINNMWIDISSMWNDTKKIKQAVENLYNEKVTLLENEVEKSKINISLSEKDLELAKSNYINTSKLLSWTSISNDQKIKQAENTLNMAKNSLENNEKLLESDKINIQKNAINSLTNAYIIAKNWRDYIDTILWVTDLNRNKNDSYEQYLWAKNSNTKTIAEKSFIEFNKSYEETYKLYNELILNKGNLDKDTLFNVLNNALKTLESLRTSLHDTMDALNSSITSNYLTEDTLNWMKNQVSTLLENLEQSILSSNWSWVKWSIEWIEKFENNYNLKVKQLEDAVKISEEDLNLAKTGKDINSSDISKSIENLKTNIWIKEDNLKISKVQNEEALKNIEVTKQEKLSKMAEIDANISEINSKVSETYSKKAEVQMNTNQALNSIESWIIKAPFDWVIIDKFFDIGSVVWSWIPIIKISSNDWKYIKTYIDNSIYWLSIWAEVNLQDEKREKTLTWKIINIDKVQDLSKKKNYTEVQINNNIIQIWDRLVLILWKEKKEKQIVIPTNSLVNKYNMPWVFLIKNGFAKFQIVKIKETDENFTSVEWVKLWEKVIVDWKDNILDWEKLEIIKD